MAHFPEQFSMYCSKDFFQTFFLCCWLLEYPPRKSLLRLTKSAKLAKSTSKSIVLNVNQILNL